MKKMKMVFIQMIFFLVLWYGSIVGYAANYDNTPPQVKTAKIVQSEVFAPGKVSVTLTDFVEDETGITEISLGISAWDPATYKFLGYYEKSESFTEKPLYTGDTCTIEIPVDSKAQTGVYSIDTINIYDARNNFRFYGNVSGDDTLSNEYELTEPTPMYADENINARCKIFGRVKIYGDEADLDLAISNPYIEDKVKAMPNGATARIFVDSTGNTIIHRGVFGAIKGTDKKVNVDVAPGVKWLFYGRNINDISKDVNCSVHISTIKDKLYGDVGQQFLKIDFAPNGILPGKAIVKIKADYIYQMYKLSNKLYLYYLDSSQLVLEDNPKYILDGTDHWCEFEITHNSTFYVSGKPLNITAEVQPELNTNAVSLGLGKTFKLKVTKKGDSDKIRAFKSSDYNVASVDGSGKITARETGSCIITVEMESGKTVKCKVVVPVVKTKKIYGLKKKIAIEEGKSFTLTPTVKPANSTQGIKYISSNKKIAIVSEKGRVKARKAGTVRITVKSGNIKKVITVIVSKPTTQKISNVKSKLKLKKGKVYILSPKLRPSNSGDKITYISSNRKVATVSSKGKIVAKGKGKTIITVKAGKIKEKCILTVK